MKAITQRISGSACGSTSIPAALGKVQRMMVSPAAPALLRTRCQISSLMKGASGCSARSRVSRVSIKVKRVPRFAAAPAASDCSTAFENSTYQSQNSCQVNSYSALATVSRRYSANPDSTRASIAASLARIHRSAKLISAFAASPATSALPAPAS